MKILLLCYAVSPYRGSEYSVAWNHISSISKNNKVTVIYGTSGDHLGDDKDLPEYLSKNSFENVDFHFVRPKRLTKVLNYFNANGFLPYTFYFAYKQWHKNVFSYVTKELDLESFDIIHFQSPIGYREPGYLWKLDKPYVWGPIGGANNIDMRLLPLLSSSGKFKQIFRGIINRLQLRYSFRLKQALKNTNVLLTATTENRDAFMKWHKVNSFYLPENGTMGKYQGHLKNHDINNKIKLIWIGRIDASKGLKLLIDAFELVNDKDLFEINIIGDGPMAEYLQRHSQEKGLNKYFLWNGLIKRSKVHEMLSSSDLHIITSVSEANTTVLLEAIQQGVPTMTLDHCGMRDTVRHDSGIKIKIEKYSDLTKSLAHSLDEIASGKILLNDFGAGVEQSFYSLHWESRTKFFQYVYEKAVKDWKA